LASNDQLETLSESISLELHTLSDTITDIKPQVQQYLDLKIRDLRSFIQTWNEHIISTITSALENASSETQHSGSNIIISQEPDDRQPPSSSSSSSDHDDYVPVKSTVPIPQSYALINPNCSINKISSERT
jgi:hypothetical protein